MLKPIISADSHVTEPGNTYTDYIDPAFRDRAPRIVHDEQRGDMFHIEGIKRPVPMGLVAGAGKKPEDLTTFGIKFEDLHRGGWDPDARLLDQDRDGVAAEIIYPTVGMVLCNHRDVDFRKACMDAYNRWITEYCGAHPERLLGIGQTAVRSVKETIEDFRHIKEVGLHGVMMPGLPGTEEDYDSPVFDPLWEAAVDLELPVSFHILTAREAGMTHHRGPRINSFLAIIRGCQDIMGMFIYGGVFERNPELKLVCVEADAGWVPHYMYRMDHAYKRHRHWMSPGQELAKLPSEYFRDNIYVTFQDDWVAFQMTDLCNPRRLMWASDFPHSDSTWPWSQEVITEQTQHLSDELKNMILHDNVAELYHLNVN